MTDRALRLLVLTAALAGSTARAQPPGCFHPVVLGANGTQPELARQANLGWLRFTIRWKDVNPQPYVFDFVREDAIVDDARARGVQVLAILSTAPQWAGSNPNGTRPPADLSLWQTFVRETVRHFAGRVAAYEIWNEPNLRDIALGVGWDADLDASPRYVDYLRSAAEILRSEDPSAKVLGLAASSLPDSRTAQLVSQLEQPFADGSRGSDYLDVVSFHANALTDEAATTVEGRIGEHLTSLFRRNPGSQGKPVWITELGWSSDRVGELAQRERIETLLDHLSRSCDPLRPELVMLFQLRDFPQVESRGLFHADGSPKPIARLYLGNLPFPATTRDPLGLAWSYVCRNLFCEFEANEWQVNPFVTPQCRWDFGDGTSGGGCRTRHVYQDAGSRLVRLSVLIDEQEIYRREATLVPEGSCQDPEPPTLRLLSPGAGATDVAPDPRLLVGLRDNIGLFRLDFAVDGRQLLSLARPDLELPTAELRWQTAGFAPGPHRLSISLSDRCNNTVRVDRDVFLDAKSPQIELEPPLSRLVSERVEIPVAASDNRGIDRVELFLDGLPPAVDRKAPFSLSWNTRVSDEGPHRLYAVAYDRAGNASRSATVVLVADNRPPELFVSTPSHGSRVSGVVRVAGWAVDASGSVSLELLLDGAPLTSLGGFEAVPRPSVCASFARLADPRCPGVGFRTFFDASSLEPGRHTLAVRARDALGRAAVSELTIEVTPSGAR